MLMQCIFDGLGKQDEIGMRVQWVAKLALYLSTQCRNLRYVCLYAHNGRKSTFFFEKIQYLRNELLHDD